MRGALLTLALLIVALVPASPTALADGCSAGAPPAWFLGVVYDAAKAAWARHDVQHMEGYLTKLREVYCIPSASGKVLAFEDDYTAQGKTYETGSEANVKSYLAQFGAAAADAEDPHFFFVLSSHGIMSAHTCPEGLPRFGSLAALKDGGGQDGDLRDCELGHELTTRFPAATRMWIFADCSFCGGFSDSLTAVSGTVTDDAVPRPSGIVAPNRVVLTGCAITTECFGASGGSVTYNHLTAVLNGPIAMCDGWTAPGFPLVYGANAPAQIGPVDGRCGASEWFYGAVNDAYTRLDYIGIQQQFRMKWGFTDVADDIVVK